PEVSLCNQAWRCFGRAHCSSQLLQGSVLIAVVKELLAAIQKLLSLLGGLHLILQITYFLTIWRSGYLRRREYAGVSQVDISLSDIHFGCGHLLVVFGFRLL